MTVMKKHFSYILVLTIFVFTLSSCFQKTPIEEQNQNEEVLDIDKETSALLDELLTVTEEEASWENTTDEMLQQESWTWWETWAPEIEEDYTSGSIILDDFASMMSISSPTTITGKAPRAWFFEWSFPVALLTLENEILDEAPATWDWLEPVWESEEISENDMIDFTTTLEFEIPADSTWEAKIRFLKLNMSWEWDEEYFEEMVILAD